MTERETETSGVAGPREGGDETLPRQWIYAFKPSVFAAPWQFELAHDGLAWQAGLRKGRTAYGDIRRLRLSYRPSSMQAHRYLAEIWPTIGGKLQLASSSWRSMIESERHDAAYSAFVRELHRRVVAARPDAVFEAGTAWLIYWPGLVLFVGLALAMAVLAVHALQVDQGLGAALIGAFLALFLWQIGTFFRRNRPRRYRGTDAPAELLP